MAEIQHYTSSNKEWKLRLEGRVLSQEKEEEILQGSCTNRFLNFFERIKVDFPNGEYPSVEWAKAKSDQGSAFDCLEITRNYSKDHL